MEIKLLRLQCLRRPNNKRNEKIQYQIVMNKLLRRLTGWLVKKTNYTPSLPLPIQPIIIKPEDLKKFHAQQIINWHEWYLAKVEPDYFVRQFKYGLVDKLLNEIIIKAEETPDGVMYSCDLLFKCV